MFFLVRLFFTFILFFSSSQKVLAIDWFEVNPSPGIFWDIDDDEITGITNHLLPAGFLLSNDVGTSDFSWQLNFIPKQGLDHNIVWGFVDEDNYYQLHFAGGSLWVNRFINGQEMLARGISFGWEFNQDYLIKIVRKDGLLSLFVDEYELFNFFDFTYDEQTSIGNWGFKIAPGASFPVESVFYNFHFLDPNILMLSIKKIMQTDSLWSDQTYDNASSWSTEPAIGRWGCALTSATMILNFYGFNEFSGGEKITPLSLNNWLKNQADGYVGNGLLNWLSITRLVNELSDLSINEVVVLPKLEFSIIKDDWDISTEMMIRSGIPVIGHLPGHFLVINGFNESNGSFSVLDPYFDREILTSDDEIDSLRIFQPSFTDLSFFLIAHDLETEILVKDEGGELMETIEVVEGIDDGKKSRLTFLSKPIEQKYILEIVGDNKVEVYVYSDTADFNKFVIEKNNLENKIIIIDFKKNNNSTIEHFFNWQYFLERLNYFYEQGKISLVAKNRVEERVYLIKESTNKKRHEDYLKVLLDFYLIYSDGESINKLKEISNSIIASASLLE